MSSPFKQNQFENPIETARQVANVIFVVKNCPELEVQLSLLQPRKITKRRRSASSACGRPKIKQRRYSCAALLRQQVIRFY